MSVKKKQPDVNTEEEKRSFGKTGQCVSKDDADFMAILRSQRLTLREIAKHTGFSKSTVENYVKHVKYKSKTSDFNLAAIIRQLAMTTAIKAYQDGGMNGKEYADTIEKYFRSLEKIEGLRMEINKRDEMLSLEKMLKEEEMPEEVAEAIQARYEKIRKELLG